MDSTNVTQDQRVCGLIATYGRNVVEVKKLECVSRSMCCKWHIAWNILHIPDSERSREREVVLRSSSFFYESCNPLDIRPVAYARLGCKATQTPFIDVCRCINRRCVCGLHKSSKWTGKGSRNRIAFLDRRSFTHGSLIMLTTNSLVSFMFSRVSFGFCVESVKVTLISGGLWDSFKSKHALAHGTLECCRRQLTNEK